MPRVPVYGQPQVQQRPTPGVRLNAVPVLPKGGDPMAAGMMNLGADVGAVANAERQERERKAAELAEKELRRANQVAVITAEQELAGLHIDIEKRISQTRGRDAAGLPDAVLPEFDKKVVEIRERLSNDDQKIAFANLAASRRESLNRYTTKYVSSEIQRFDDEETKSYVLNAQDEAGLHYKDSERIRQSILRQQGAIADYARSHGLGEEARQRATADAVSRTHKTVIDRFLANGEAKQAESYFKAVRDEMQADEATKSELTFESLRVARAQKAEADARRAAAEAERRVRNAEAEFNAASAIILQGKRISPEYATKVSQAVAGTPYEAAFRETLKDGPESAAFGSLPLAAQDQAIADLRAELNRVGTDPAREKRLAMLEKIRDQSRKDYGDDPLSAATERGILPELARVDVSTPQTFAATVRDRVRQADLVRQQTGRAVPPLTRQEADAFSRTLQSLPVQQQGQAIRLIASALPDPGMAQAFAKQINDKDRTLGLALFAATAPNVEGKNLVDLLLRGSDAVKTGRMKPASEDPTRRSNHTEIARQISEIPWPTTQARDAAIEAAQTLYDGLKDERGSASVREAIRLAVGGGVAEWNGSKVPLPPGWDERRFKRSIAELSPDTLRSQAGGAEVYVGGAAVPVDKFARSMGAIKLIPVGPGVYAMESGGAIVLDANRRPMRLDLTKPVDTAAAR